MYIITDECASVREKMTQSYYLIFLILGIAGLALADKRFKLLFFDAPKRAATLILLGVAFFLLWDIVGITLGVFATNQQWVTGAYVYTPNLPIEEFLFLAMFCYVTLITWSLVWRRMS